MFRIQTQFSRSYKSGFSDNREHKMICTTTQVNSSEWQPPDNGNTSSGNTSALPLCAPQMLWDAFLSRQKWIPSYVSSWVDCFTNFFSSVQKMLPFAQAPLGLRELQCLELGWGHISSCVWWSEASYVETSFRTTELIICQRRPFSFAVTKTRWRQGSFTFYEKTRKKLCGDPLVTNKTGNQLPETDR